jgi:multidrug efflux pump
VDERSPAIILNIQRQPGANVIEVVDAIKQLLPQLQARCRRGRRRVLTDRTVTIRASVEDVQFELLLAVALVVLVIFLFLRTSRRTSSRASRCRCRSSAPSASCISPASASTT